MMHKTRESPGCLSATMSLQSTLMLPLAPKGPWYHQESSGCLSAIIMT